MKKRILFVDDEVNVLQGLQRMLRSMRNEWQMEFALCGQKALEIMSQTPFDMIVSDMRMPGMDGAELLNEVMQRYPDIVRIILSGQASKEEIIKSIGPTHQYLPKPCDAEKLKATIARAFAQHDLLKDRKLKELVSRMKSLPSLPSLYLELRKELQSPEVTMAKVGEIISKDVGMTAKILQLINSAYFGLPVHVSSAVHAAKLLGPEIIKSLVLSVQIFSMFDQTKLSFLSLEKFLNHSLSVGSFAKKIAMQAHQNEKATDHALIAGILHDVGKLILAENLPEQYKRTLSLANTQRTTIWEAELATFGATHAEVGAYLLGLWGLPENVVEVVAFHHWPARCLNKCVSPLTAVHVANILERELLNEDNETTQSSVDLNFLHQLGLANQLTIWRQICSEVQQARNVL